MHVFLVPLGVLGVLDRFLPSGSGAVHVPGAAVPGTRGLLPACLCINWHPCLVHVPYEVSFLHCISPFARFPPPFLLGEFVCPLDFPRPFPLPLDLLPFAASAERGVICPWLSVLTRRPDHVLGV